VWKTEQLYRDGLPLWIEHPQLGDKADIAALLLTDLDDVKIIPHQLSGDPALIYRPSDAVSVVGFPFGIRTGGSLAVWATGFVASEPEVDFDDLPVFLVDCRTRKGQSGSPVVVHRNSGMVRYEDGRQRMIWQPETRFIGVYSGRINEQSDLGQVWKASAVAELISSA